MKINTLRYELHEQGLMTISRILTWLVGIVWVCFPINSYPMDTFSGWDEFIVDWASGPTDEPLENIVTEHHASVRDEGNDTTDCATAFSPLDILEFLMIAQVPIILSFNTYLRTNPPVIRPLLDLPTLYPTYDPCDRITFSGTFFYNQMKNMYLTNCGPCLRDYLAVLSDGDFINALDNFFNTVFPGANIPNVIPLFNNIRLDMRRLGVVFGITSCPGRWRVSMAFPLYYLENNFYLAQPDLDRLNTQRYFSDVSIGNMPENPDLFVRRHLINDKIGISDVRWMLDYCMGSGQQCQARLGLQGTFPLNWIIAEGIYGNCFNRLASQPVINAQQIACLYCLTTKTDTDEDIARAHQAQVVLADLLLSYGVSYLDWLTATVATNPIGQNTPSVGVYLQPEWHVSRHVRIGIWGEYDYWAPQYIPRTFNTIFNAQEVAQTDYTADPDQALSNLLFLQQQAQNVLYPPVYPVKVKQGDVVKARTWLTYERRTYAITGGFDLWYQAHEKIYICAPSLVGKINTQTAARPAALQAKLYGMFDTHFYDEDVSSFGWKLGLRAEGTIYHSGIGNDWLIGVHVVGDF